MPQIQGYEDIEIKARNLEFKAVERKKERKKDQNGQRAAIHPWGEYVGEQHPVTITSATLCIWVPFNIQPLFLAAADSERGIEVHDEQVGLATCLQIVK